MVRTVLGLCCVMFPVDRWRWSLFAVAVMLLVSLTLLITFFFRDFVKSKFHYISCLHKCGVAYIKYLKIGLNVVLYIYKKKENNGVYCNLLFFS